MFHHFYSKIEYLRICGFLGSKHFWPSDGLNWPWDGNSYQSFKHVNSSLCGGTRDEGGKGRPEGRGGRPDVVILADNMKSGASSDRASNFPGAAVGQSLPPIILVHQPSNLSRRFWQHHYQMWWEPKFCLPYFDAKTAVNLTIKQHFKATWNRMPILGRSAFVFHPFVA